MTVLGGDPWRDAVRLHRRLAYVPGEVNLWPNLTGGEVIDLLGALRGGLDRTRRKVLLDRFLLDPSKQCRAYSKGNRQKVALVAAFASDVELYLLDEPSSGLDPLMEIVFQDVVRELRDAGRTVLLSSHILAEVEALCDRVTIIRAGRAAETGTFEELRHLTRTSVDVETARPIDTLTDLPGIHDVPLDLAGFNAVVDRLLPCPLLGVQPRIDHQPPGAPQLVRQLPELSLHIAVIPARFCGQPLGVESPPFRMC